MEQIEKHRPLGVTLIVLTILSGIAFFASGITAVAVVPFLSGATQTLLVGLSTITGAAFLALGIAYFVMTYGLLKGKGWAWAVTLVLSCIGLALGFASIVTGHIGAIFNIIISALIIYYIYRPNVKSFFGKTTTAGMTYMTK
jgi:membrane associated rhomboid family serine protease